jgi:hypothetical protein
MSTFDIQRMTRAKFAKWYGYATMRRNDPIQFEVLFVEHCRERSYTYYSK